jgi:hypothetical protein
MGNSQYLAQARQGSLANINVNPQPLSILVLTDPQYPKKGGIPKCFTGRISNRTRTIADLNESPAGLSTDLGKMLLVYYDVCFLEAGNIITDQNGKEWKLGAITPNEKFGGVVSYQIQLEEA